MAKLIKNTESDKDFSKNIYASNENILPVEALEKDLAANQERLKNGNIPAALPKFDNLKMLTQTRQLLQERKCKTIHFKDAIMYHNDTPIIFPSTIVLLQGQTGTHKSRVAQLFCSVFLSIFKGMVGLLDFYAKSRVFVLFVDTERNLTEQLPYALQQIQIQAGFSMEEEPANFDFISLLEIPRKERFEALDAYLRELRKRVEGHIFVVLDVVTDCLDDFNRTDSTMQLVDMLNISINKHDTTFCCVIHENPGINNKARGHAGTELVNKASTVIQVALEDEEADVYRIKFLKTRSTKKPEPIHFYYDETAKTLKLAENDSFKIKEQGKKITINDVINVLEAGYLGNFPLSKKVICEELCNWLSIEVSEKTIMGVLDTMINDKLKVVNQHKPYFLHKEKKGREVFFNLIEAENE